MKLLLTKFIFLIEGFFLCLWILICRTIGIDFASNLGSVLAKIIGPLSKFDIRAQKNIKKIFPNIKIKEQNKIIRGMWDNLGRNIGEFPFANKLNPYKSKKINSLNNGPRFVIEGKQHLENIYHNQSGAIFFSAHIGNWEICPLILSGKDLKVTSIYRHANNPINEKIIQWMRKGISIYAPKGPTGAKTLFKALRKKEFVAILADQKLNEGELIDFLGHPAKTATAIAELSLKLSIPIIPIHVERIKGASFRYIIDKPIINLKKNYNHKEELIFLLNKINKKIEKWIRENPEQWLWIHNRW